MKLEACAARFYFLNLNKKEIIHWVLCDTLLLRVEENKFEHKNIEGQNLGRV